MNIEVVEINTGNLISDASLSSDIEKPSVNFGQGVEMLMNDKRKTTTPKNASTVDEIDMKELNRLEHELNDLYSTKSKSVATTEAMNSIPKSSVANFNDSIDLDSNPNNSNNISIKTPTTTPKSSSSSSSSFSFLKKDVDLDLNRNTDNTWDGYQRFKDIPVNMDMKTDRPVLTKEETLKQKFEYLKKLENLEKKGAELSKKYTMESNLDEMIGEYETLVQEKEKSNSVKFQGKALMAVITGLEFLNNKFDPFDVKLDGWAESIGENLEDYDDIFSELHDKYSSKATMAPELKLLFQLGGSAIMLHMTNTMFKSSLPGMDDIMRQNPELMQQFTQAAVNTMGQQQPGFGNFMNGMMGSGNGNVNGSSSNSMPPMGSPPGPYQTSEQGQNAGDRVNSKYAAMEEERKSMIPPTNERRPDIGMSRGIARFNDAEDLSNSFDDVTNMNKQEKSKRPEMKGPRDISEILSGLKPKTGGNTSNRQNEPRPSFKRTPINVNNDNDMDEVGSTISLDDFQTSRSNVKLPKKTNKRTKSEKTTVSLNI
jgi:hypothetical protein